MSTPIKPEIDEDAILEKLESCVDNFEGTFFLNKRQAYNVLHDLFAQSAENDRLAAELKTATDQIKAAMEKQQATNVQLEQMRIDRDQARAKLADRDAEIAEGHVAIDELLSSVKDLAEQVGVKI